MIKLDNRYDMKFLVARVIPFKTHKELYKFIFIVTIYHSMEFNLLCQTCRSKIQAHYQCLDFEIVHLPKGPFGRRESGGKEWNAKNIYSSQNWEELEGIFIPFFSIIYTHSIPFHSFIIYSFHSIINSQTTRKRS